MGEDIAEKGQSFFFLDKSEGVDEALEKLLRSPQGIEREEAACFEGSRASDLQVEVEPAIWHRFEST